MKRKPLESTEEALERVSDFLTNLCIATGIIVVCHSHLERQAKVLEDQYPEINIEKEFGAVFEKLDEIGNKLTKYAEKVMEIE